MKKLRCTLYRRLDEPHSQSPVADRPMYTYIMNGGKK
jgi:hypothetical protein